MSLSDYEKLRLDRIESNKRKLVELGLDKSPFPMAKANKHTKQKRKTPDAKIAPQRKSSRHVTASEQHSSSHDDDDNDSQSSPPLRSIPKPKKPKSAQKPQTTHKKARRSSVDHTPSVLNDNPRVVLPFSEDDLSEVEKKAFLALREWKRARGKPYSLPSHLSWP